MLSAEATAPYHPAHAFFETRYRALVDSIARAYEQAAANGRVRPGIDAAQAARALIALLDGLQVQWLFADGSFDMAAVVRVHLSDQLVALIMAG